MRQLSPDQRGSVRTDWLIAITAVVSLLVSIVAIIIAYPKAPKPFGPSLSTGQPILRENIGLLSIALPVRLANSGDEEGCISDVALRLQSKTLKTEWTYFPVFQVNMERYLKAPANKEDPFLAVEAPASTIDLPGKSTVQQVMLFLPRPASVPQLEPLRVKDLKQGETYVLSVFIAHEPSKCQKAKTTKYEQVTSMEFVLNQQQIDDLSKALTQLPLDAAHDKVREQFVSGSPSP